MSALRERAGGRTPTAAELAALGEVERRVLWLATRIVDHANRERRPPRPAEGRRPPGVLGLDGQHDDGALVLGPGADDRVSVKPHASPVLHAISYLLGRLEQPQLKTLREFGGLQAYPSRTKDPFPRRLLDRLGRPRAPPRRCSARWPPATSRRTSAAPRRGRFISLLGDAELDEGNVWEAILDPATQGLGEAVWLVDLNRQSLDRVVPVIKAGGLQRGFESAGWNVVELKYGSRLREAFARGRRRACCAGGSTRCRTRSTSRSSAPTSRR